MARNELGAVLDGIALRILRTRILLILEELYPNHFDKKMLFSHFGKETKLRVIERELCYLAEKNLITLSSSVEEYVWARITPRGRDFLLGDVQEVGLASPIEV